LAPKKEGVYNIRPSYPLSWAHGMKNYLIDKGMAPPPWRGYGDNDITEPVFILTGLDEVQVHFYGNLNKQVAKKYLDGFKPLGRRNLGQELAYCFDEFLKQNPNGSTGNNIGPKNVPYTIEGKNGLYTTRFLVKRGTKIFKDVSLDDIVQLNQELVI